MDTISDNEVRRLRTVMRALAGLSALVHGALGVYCIVRHLQAPAPSPHSFALYRTRVSAERFLPAPNASVADDLARAYAKTCAAAAGNATGTLVLHAAGLGQSWLPERADLTIDGLVLLAVVFFLSCASQCFYAYTTLCEQALETFRQPCLVRWLEYAATAPLQVALVAMCVLVRDVHTLALLLAAQAASVLVGFALEYALGSGDLEDPLEKTYLARSPPALHDHPVFEFGIGAIVCGPIVDERFMRTHADKAARAWEVCFAVAGLLHAAVWAVLVYNLLAVEASLCASAPHPAVAPLRLLVAGQCALFSCFALVQLLQLFWLWTRDVDASTAFLYGNVLYAVLSLVGKSHLLASYVTFVELSPHA
jgi:hypothetical protein